MQSVFTVIKEPLEFDAAVFDEMRQIAGDLLCGVKPGEYTGAVVLQAASGAFYGQVIENALSREKADERALLDRLKAAKATRAHRILYVWQDEGAVDLPSHDFRAMLSELDPANDEAGIFVKTAEGYSVIRLGRTMK